MIHLMRGRQTDKTAGDSETDKNRKRERQKIHNVKQVQASLGFKTFNPNVR